MKTIRKLRSIYDLQMSQYGQPWPRHGLQLLFWFANDCIWVNEEEDEMFLVCDMANGDFGFHPFENRCIYQDQKLLPDVSFPYYVVGNLNYDKADMLPESVKSNAEVPDELSNTDRIIVTAQEWRKFGKIYVTKHSDLSNYDKKATFHVSRSLLKIIRSFQSAEDFTRSVNNQEPLINYRMCMITIDEERVDDSDSEPEDEKETKSAGMYYVNTVTKPRRNSCCTIL